jgi:hypothetical protein
MNRLSAVRIFVPCLFVVLFVVSLCLGADPVADHVYRNGEVFTADARSSIAQAVAIREGRIIYVS